MKNARNGIAVILFVVATQLIVAADEVDLDARLKASAQSFSERIESTTRDLAEARERIGSEKSELARRLGAAQDRVLALRTEAETLAEKKAEIAASEARSAKEVELLEQNVQHVQSSIAESLSNLRSGMGPGSRERERQSIDQLLASLRDGQAMAVPEVVGESLTLLEAKVVERVGGRRVVGSALAAGENRLREGHYFVFGPAAYFTAEDGDLEGMVVGLEDSGFGIAHPVGEWSPDAAAALGSGQIASLPMDATGGKAAQFEQERGGVWTHIRKGGLVAMAILALGLFALATTVFKLWDLRHMEVDRPERVVPALRLLAESGPSRFDESLASFKKATRELLQVGQRHLEKPKMVLEDHLYANILVQRLRSEKLLPMLRVIATAAPLLGLLGTVVGMVKTFTLITIFGTGNAEKLSSGISEALVTTELGLIVAIPTLVAYGFLSHRSHRSLSLLEQYSVELVAAAEESRTRTGGQT